MALLQQLKLLVNLARIDGDMAEREKEYILNIGKANGFPESSVSTLFYGSHEVVIPENLTPDERFDYLFSLVQLMKIDERLYRQEMQFCSKIAERLGYSHDVMFDLLTHINSTTEKKEQQALRALFDQYLKK